MSNAPTLINLPPPPSDPVTPSDVPGTPNSTTTSMSELSTVAIKDGHRGHLPHHHQQNPLDAERADRISRLAGLERVAAAGGGRSSNLNPSSAAYTGGHHATGSSGSIPPTQGYFDANNQPQIMRERSTVGSASATGSIGGRTTTWASGSDVGYDAASIADRMSEDQDMETSSMGGFSDEGAASLVGFGEGARTPARAQSGAGMNSPIVAKAQASIPGSAVPGYLRGETPTSPMTGVSSTGAAGGGSGASTPSTEAQVRDAQRIDGVTYDAGITDTTTRTPPPLAHNDDQQQQQMGAANAAQWMERQAEREQAERH